MASVSLHSSLPRFRSRAVAATLALLAGALGGHHFYLGRRLWWIYPLVALPMLALALRADEWYRQWPAHVAAVVVLVSLGEAIRIALISDEKWDARFNQDSEQRSRNGVGVILVAIVSLMLAELLGMTVLSIVSENIVRSLA